MVAGGDKSSGPSDRLDNLFGNERPNKKIQT